MSPWVYLVVAGCFEVAWAVGLKFTQSFTKPLPSALTIAAIVASMYLLARATQEIPLGTAYAVWVGIGAAGAAVAGVVLFGEPVNAARMICIAMLIAAVIGLKLTSLS